MLEKVQCRTTKLVLGYKKLPYQERLRLKLHRSEELRLCGDLIDKLKLLTVKENVNPDQFLNTNINNRRGHSKKLNKEQCMKLAQLFLARE